MATISKGITLTMGDKVLTNLMEIPELGGTSEAIDVTTLADPAFKYVDGILSYGDSLEFKFLYEQAQFVELDQAEGTQEWKVGLPDGAIAAFSGGCSVRLEGVGVNAALTYILAIKPESEITWTAGA